MKRKSNFDVTPEQFAAMKQQAQAAAAALLQTHQQQPYHVMQHQMFGASPYQPQPPQMAQYGGPTVHATSYAQPYLPPFEVHDQKYRDKLEAALQRNFDYVERLDAIAAGLIPGPAVEAPKLFARQFKQLNRPRPVQTGRQGIGSAPQRTSDLQATSVYVAGLPPNFTHPQLEGLFSSFGKVTRCKLYKDDRGELKGDALVTFAKPTSATNALKINGFAITEQHTLSVTPADFSKKQRKEEAKLPPECEADRFPVVLFRNMYISAEAESDPNFFVELEADLLEMCVKFGKIRRVVSPEGDAFEGTVAVTFADEAAARNCAVAMHGRLFDGREVEAELVGGFWGRRAEAEVEDQRVPQQQEVTTTAQLRQGPASSQPEQAQTAATTPATIEVATGTVVAAAAPPNVRASEEPAEDPLAAFFETIGELEKSIS